ncbi:MAG: hypothetical protein RJQ07_02630, partial [Pseudomonadales bacterium]
AHELGHAQQIAPAQSIAQVERYLSEYRHSGDDAWLHAAEPFLWSSGTSQRADLALLRAWHAQAEHKFGRALDEIEPLLAGGTRQPGLWLLHANLLRVQGHYAAARESCREALNVQILTGQLCLVQVDLAQGTPVPAPHADLFARLLDTSFRQTTDPGIQGWAFDVLAQLYASVDRLDEALEWAGRAYRAEDTIQRRAALADLLLKAQKPQAVLALVGEHTTAPALVVLRLSALKALGQLPQQSAEVARIHTVFQQQFTSGDYLHAREMALFYLQIMPRPALARELALANWQHQREAEDRKLLLQTGGLQQVDG